MLLFIISFIFQEFLVFLSFPVARTKEKRIPFVLKKRTRQKLRLISRQCVKCIWWHFFCWTARWALRLDFWTQQHTTNSTTKSRWKWNSKCLCLPLFAPFLLPCLQLRNMLWYVFFFFFFFSWLLTFLSLSLSLRLFWGLFFFLGGTALCVTPSLKKK